MSPCLCHNLYLCLPTKVTNSFSPTAVGGRLTYKHLLAIHHIKKDESINLFDLLVNGVLKHFKYSLTGGKEMGELWTDVQEVIARSTGRAYSSIVKREERLLPLSRD